jgi:hypothetical protein
MAEKAVYEHGELERVRGNLGDVDRDEAKRMAKVLGGEVGVEKTAAPAAPDKSSRTIPKHRIELISDVGESSVLKFASRKFDPSDDPSVPLKQSYFERVKMDRFAWQPEFDMKNLRQVLISMLSIFQAPTDYVSRIFVTKRMTEYYKKIELLVVSTRAMFPRNNLKRNEQLKRVSPIAYAVLDTIRYWNIERITGDLAKMQAHPRNIKASDFTEILRTVYKPLFVLERLSPEIHIKGAYQLLYKYLYIENPMEVNKYQELVRTALSSYVSIRRDVHYLLYPLLLRLVSNKWLPYDRFFDVRRNRFMAFLNVTEADQIPPGDLLLRLKPKAEAEKPEEQTEEQVQETDPEKVKVVDVDEDEATKVAEEPVFTEERQAVEKGLNTLEDLFPSAGWGKIEEYPDFFPYFTNVLDIKKGYELLSPKDPMLQFVVLAHILEELFFGLRSISFTPVTTSEGSIESVDQRIGSILNNWRSYINDVLEKEYINRLTEYCEVLAGAAEARTSTFARHLMDELSLAKRLYFFPHFKYTAHSSQTAIAFQKNDAAPFFREIKMLHRSLAIVAEGIKRGIADGGAAENAICNGIENPWKSYVFQVANPISKRLDLLLNPNKKNNASLVLFSLDIATVLDYLVNDEGSWAYNPPSNLLFRSVNGEGAIPQFGVDEKINADAIFKQMIRERNAK